MVQVIGERERLVLPNEHDSALYTGFRARVMAGIPLNTEKSPSWPNFRKSFAGSSRLPCIEMPNTGSHVCPAPGLSVVWVTA